MKSRMRSLLKSRKAQFYILSGFVIVGILYSVGRWIEPPTIIDTSSVALLEDPFIFNNIKEKAIQVVKISKSCEELNYNLDEYSKFVRDYVAAKKIALTFSYTVLLPCNPNVMSTTINMSLRSTQAYLISNFLASK
ncbi:MAG: hypothetical protein J4452_04640 [Candidatus Aenigmarchaeota archaeon]|nr:hypothetical protein [Candidatus Aenigmarchaeota archaeon]